MCWQSHYRPHQPAADSILIIVLAVLSRSDLLQVQYFATVRLEAMDRRLAALILIAGGLLAAPVRGQSAPIQEPLLPPAPVQEELPAPAAAEIESPLESTGDVELLEPDFELLLSPDWMLAPQPHEPPDLMFNLPYFEEVPVPDNAEKKLKDFKPPKIWEGRVEFGANGSEGNSERFATRYGGKLKRSTLRNLWTMDILYSTSYAKDVQNENKMLADTRSEWPFGFSPWFAYTHGTAEYDQFKAYDWRLTNDSGLGYQYLNTGVTQFKGRMGVGVSQQLKSDDELFTPEGIFGFTFEHKLTKRQKLIATTDMFHDLEDVDDFRSRSNASWEIKIDPPARLSLRFGIINRYDSTANGKKKNDLDYSSVVVWEF